MKDFERIFHIRFKTSINVTRRRMGAGVGGCITLFGNEREPRLEDDGATSTTLPPCSTDDTGILISHRYSRSRALII